MLKPDTERVWDFLQRQPALSGFILLGGSALTLRLHHRYSEDLDFAWPDLRLPCARLEAFRRAALEAGFDFQPQDDPRAMAEFVQGSLDRREYQQDYLVDRSVKVSFLAPEPAVLAVLERLPASAAPRIATLEELFRMKGLLTARRSRTRDWYDLYILMSRCGYSMRDFYRAFERAGQPEQVDIALQRLCGGKPQAADEGFEQIVSGPPNLEEMQQFFQIQRDRFERSEAAQARRGSNSSQG